MYWTIYVNQTPKGGTSDGGADEGLRGRERRSVGKVALGWPTESQVLTTLNAYSTPIPFLDKVLVALQPRALRVCWGPERLYGKISSLQIKWKTCSTATPRPNVAEQSTKVTLGIVKRRNEDPDRPTTKIRVPC